MNNLLNLLLFSTASLSSMNHTNPSAKKNSAAFHRMDQSGAQETSTDEMSTQSTSTNAAFNNNTSTQDASNDSTSGSNIATQGTSNNVASNGNMATQGTTNNEMTNNLLADYTGEVFPMQPIFNAQVDALLPNDLMARFVLPPLPFAYDALEPYIDAETMRLHHNRHHQTYINNLNNAISRYPELYAYTLGQLLTYADRLPSDVQSAIINNGGGHYNHSFFWNILSPDSETLPTGSIGSAINREFGSFSNFKRAFTAAALSVFGSGYAWLTLTPGGRLEIITTRNQDTPLPLNLIPLLTIDVWEHAYYLKSQNNRDRYIENWFNVINWPYVNSIYEAAING